MILNNIPTIYPFLFPLTMIRIVIFSLIRLLWRFQTLHHLLPLPWIHGHSQDAHHVHDDPLHTWMIFTLSYLFRRVDLGRLCARPQPSARDSFPLVTYGFLQKRTKGRLSGRLHSDTQVSQQETPKNYAPPYRSTVKGTLKVVKWNCV